MKKYTRHPKFGNGLVQLIRMENSTRQIIVNRARDVMPVCLNLSLQFISNQCALNVSVISGKPEVNQRISLC